MNEVSPVAMVEQFVLKIKKNEQVRSFVQGKNP